MATDRNGKLWAKLSAVKEGDVLIADDSFDCMEPGAKVVMGDELTGLYVKCSRSVHYIAAQLDHHDHDSLIGFYHADT